jgi:zinc/manganese transport system permease protein
MTLADGIRHRIFDFTDYAALLSLVRNSLVAGVALGLVAGRPGCSC